MPIVRNSPVAVKSAPPSPPVAAAPPAFAANDFGKALSESNERLVVAVRLAVEANARTKKVVNATVERDKDGLITKIRMEVEGVA